MKVHVRMGDSHGSGIALFLLVIGFALYWYFTTYDRPITNVPSPNIQTKHPVVALGGAITAGSGSLQSGGYIDMLSEDLKTTITTISEPRMRARDAWAIIDNVTRLEPRVVIIELGMGDTFVPKTSSDEFYSLLERIVNKIHEAGASVILVESSQYRQSYRDISATYKTALVRDPLVKLLGDDRYMFNSNYPNDSGHRHIANDIKPVLLKILREDS